MKKTIILLGVVAMVTTACSSDTEKEVDWSSMVTRVAEMKSTAKSVEGFVSPAKNVICAGGYGEQSTRCVLVKGESVPDGVEPRDACPEGKEPTGPDITVGFKKNRSTACWWSTSGEKRLTPEDVADLEEQGMVETISEQRGASLDMGNKELTCAAVTPSDILCTTTIGSGFLIGDSGVRFFRSFEAW